MDKSQDPPSLVHRSDRADGIQPSLFEDNPVGPGQYTLPSSIPSGPSYSFAQAGRFATPSSSFCVSNSFLTPEKQRQMIGTSQSSRSKSAPIYASGRFPQPKMSDTPGPGSYEMPSTLFAGSISLKGKHKASPAQLTPGPGHYILSSRPGNGLPVLTSSRLAVEVSPTANVKLLYSEFKSSSPSYSMLGRPETRLPFNGPGPGSYDSPSTLNSGKMTIIGKPKDPAPSQTPGPGQYNPEPAKSERACYLRPTPHDPCGDRLPGPGEYEVKSSSAGPSYSFRGRHSASAQDTIPGPGSYDVSMPKAQSPLLRGKPKSPRENQVPGPGAYEISKDRPKLGFAQVAEIRFKNISETPGPGAYNTERPSSGPCISFSSRLSPPRNDLSVPGPGSYNPGQGSIDSQLLNKSLLISLRGKPKSPPASRTPVSTT
jgi:hypothetical protein